MPGLMIRDRLEREARARLAEREQQYFANHMPAGGIGGPAPIFPTMPQVPQMNQLPMQGGMVDFNALAGLMAGPPMGSPQQSPLGGMTGGGMGPFFQGNGMLSTLLGQLNGRGPRIAPPPGKNGAMIEPRRGLL